jgi:subtilisin family serine protease
MRYARLALSAAIAALVVGGCAGGGGGGGGAVISPPPPPASPPPPPPPPPPPAPPGIPSTSSTEYLRNWGVAGTKAITAWQAGATGQGVSVAVIDSGFDPTHPELAGQLLPASKDINASRNQFVGSDQHGSEVASFIVGNFNNDKTVGVAYGAKVLAIRADDGADGFTYADLTAAINYAVSQHVDIINLSLGSDSAGPAGFQTAIANATAAGVIVVSSAGNDGLANFPTLGHVPATEVNYPAFYATDPAVSHNLIVAAGGDNADGSFNPISNPAGSAANFYIVAPGWQVVVPDFGAPGPVPGYQVCFADNTCEIQGTSYSAPHTAAALALLKSAFPGLTPQQLVQLLLISADDMGPVGVDAIYGHGRLNLTTAFSSVGLVRAPLPGAAGELAQNEPLGVVGAAFGDAFAQDARWGVIGFDDFGRSFRMSLAPSWRGSSRASLADAPAPRLWRQVTTEAGEMQFAAAEEAPPSAALTPIDPERTPSFRAEARLGETLRVSFASGAPIAPAQTPAPFSGFMDMAGDARGAGVTAQIGAGVSLSLLTQESDSAPTLLLSDAARRADAVRANIARRRFALGATLGEMREEGAALGLAWGDRWGAQANARTHFGGVSALYALNGAMQIGVEIEAGATEMNGMAWLTPAGAINTSSASAAWRWRVRPKILARRAPHLAGALTLSVTQPMRVESGAFSALLPISDAYGRKHLAFEQRLISAEPTGREIDTQLGYALWAGDRFTAEAAISYTIDPGHSASAPDEIAARVAFRKAF